MAVLLNSLIEILPFTQIRYKIFFIFAVSWWQYRTCSFLLYWRIPNTTIVSLSWRRLMRGTQWHHHIDGIGVMEERFYLRSQESPPNPVTWELVWDISEDLNLKVDEITVPSPLDYRLKRSQYVFQLEELNDISSSDRQVHRPMNSETCKNMRNICNITHAS